MWEVNKADAISLLRPMAGFTLKGDELIWHSKDLVKPTEAEIDAKLAEMQAEYDAKDYARKREAEYPSIQECVHAILDDQLDALQAKRAEIKTKYPKG